LLVKWFKRVKLDRELAGSLDLLLLKLLFIVAPILLCEVEVALLSIIQIDRAVCLPKLEKREVSAVRIDKRNGSYALSSIRDPTKGAGFVWRPKDEVIGKVQTRDMSRVLYQKVTWVTRSFTLLHR
jgi:hypothetical protein